MSKARKELERAEKALCPSKYKRGDTESTAAFDQHIKLAQTEAIIDIAESLQEIARARRIVRDAESIRGRW